MKKLLCLVVMLTALCTAYTQVYADNALTEAIEYLSAVGIDFEYEEETIQPDQRVTRAVFAQNITKLLNISELKCTNVYYHDVSSDHWAFDNIGILTERGILSGYGDKYFRPDEYVSKEEAATILVSVLGYRAYVENSGGYPNGYMNMASDLKIFKNCSSNNDLTLSDILIMLRNVLDVNMVNTVIEDNEISYIKSDNDTLLNVYHNKYYSRGTLTGCNGVTLGSLEKISDDIAIIDGLEYVTEITGLIDNIGTEIEFLYEAEEADSDERELVWVKSLGRNDIIDIQKDRYCSYDSDLDIFSYLPDGLEKQKKINLSDGIIVIYNGAIATEDVDVILNQDKYNVRFIKTRNSSSYDIAIVWKYENIVVGQVDFFANIIYDKFDHSNSLDISENREKIVIENNLTLEQIEVGDILSYYESEDGSLLKIAVSKNVVEETAKNINDDEDMILLTDNGEYVFYDSNATFNVLNGETVKLYLDKNGYIAYLEKVKTDVFPAYLIKVSYDEDEELLYLKTLNYDGTIEKYQVAENVKLDGVKKEHLDIRTALTVEESTGGRSTVQQVIVLKLNNDKQIKSIDTVDPGSENPKLTLRKIPEFTGYRGQYKHHGRLVPKVLISQNTVVFQPPKRPSNDDKDYIVRKKSEFMNDQWYTLDIYEYLENGTGYAEIAVVKDGPFAATSKSTYLLVDEVISTVDEDGEPIEKLICNKEGKDMEILTTADVVWENGIPKSGDLIEPFYNTRGQVDKVIVQYSYGSNDRPINTRYNAEPGLRIVYVHEKIGNVLKIGHSSANSFDEIFETPGDRIVVYDNDEKEKIRKGSMWDILPGMTIAIQTIDESPYFVVVYK